MTDKTAIRDAATLILVRDPDTAPAVLMGQRGSKAAFMPNRFVFPGGAVDAGDADIPLAGDPPEPCITRLAAETPSPRAFLAAAIRELWEETGLRLASPGDWPAPPPDWREFARGGHLPDPSGLAYVFRAVTPPGRPRRFDARFFLADAGHILGDADDFSAASEELSALQWIPLEKVRGFALPFITQVVLAEVAAALPRLAPPEAVPFFDNDAEQSLFRRLGGQHPLDAVQR